MRSTLVIVALLTAACGATQGGPPSIVVDRTACSHCGMLVSEVGYAAAYQTADSEARVFDDIGCLLDAMRRAGVDPERGAQVWFHDGGDGTWIDAKAAVFVRSTQIRTPMGGGIVAYRNAPHAAQVAARHNGSVVASLRELMNARGEQP